MGYEGWDVGKAAPIATARRTPSPPDSLALRGESIAQRGKRVRSGAYRPATPPSGPCLRAAPAFPPGMAGAISGGHEAGPDSPGRSIHGHSGEVAAITRMYHNTPEQLGLRSVRKRRASSMARGIEIRLVGRPGVDAAAHLRGLRAKTARSSRFSRAHPSKIERLGSTEKRPVEPLRSRLLCERYSRPATRLADRVIVGTIGRAESPAPMSLDRGQ